MRLMHLGDLHIGKRVNEFSMIEDQKYILKEILKIAQDKKVGGVMIAGDIYDKSVPSAEAVEVLDDFLTALSEAKLPVFLISGNHDSPERLDFGSRIMEKNRVYIAGEYNGRLTKIVKDDNFGKLNIYLMPYLKPAIVNRKLSLEVKSFDEAVREALKAEKINPDERNLLIAHQFVTASGVDPDRSDSETRSLGGTDNVDVLAFKDFDYVALGHIHGPQKMGRETVRYAGSPLKYSFSEVRHQKKVTIVEIGEKNNVKIEAVSLKPLREMEEIRCTIDELKRGVPSTNYMHVTLTDEGEIIDAIAKVRETYPNVMVLDFDNQRSQRNDNLDQLTDEDLKEKQPLELFETFYGNQNNMELSKIQKSIFEDVLKNLEGDRE